MSSHNLISIYSNGNIINNNPIITTNFVPEPVYSPSGTPAVQNAGGYLDFVAYPDVRTWANSYIRTGILVNAGDEMVFHVEESLTNYADTKYTITAQTSGEICITFDNGKYDNSDTRNRINQVGVKIGIPTGTAGVSPIGGNYNYAAGVQRPVDKIRSIYLEGPSRAGDIEAIRDWIQSTRYVKDDIDYFFMRMVNDGLTPYVIKFIGLSDQTVTIVGQTSDQEYEIKLNSNGEYSGLFFFETEETLDISIEDIYSHKQITLPVNTFVTISLAKTYHIYKDGQIINSKSIQIDSHTTGRWNPDTGTAAVTNANNELTFNTWPSDTYFRESYIRTGVPVYDGDVAVLKYETNYAATNKTYNPVKNVNSDGELIITFIQTIWDRIDYRNKFQYFGMQWLDQNDAYRPLYLDPDPNDPMLRVQYGIYMYQPVDGNFDLVSISELTAKVFGDPEIVL